MEFRQTYAEVAANTKRYQHTTLDLRLLRVCWLACSLATTMVLLLLMFSLDKTTTTAAIPTTRAAAVIFSAAAAAAALRPLQRIIWRRRALALMGKYVKKH